MSRWFEYFYAILSVIIYIIFLPVLLFLLRKPKYKKSIPARFFLKNNPSFKDKRLWFHVCSLGEAKAIEPFLKEYNSRVNISVITPTGFEEALKYDADVRFLPYELFTPFWVKKADVLVVLEAEFWFMFFNSFVKRGGKIVLLNARINERSYKKYYKMRFFYKRVLDLCSLIYVQSYKDKKRFESLGTKTQVEVVGNIKLANEIKVSKFYEKSDIEIITAASTHENEELLILKAFLAYRKENISKLIIVPRHPERFLDVFDIIKENCDDFNISLFSKTGNFDSDITVVDKMGELINVYNISDVVILGGAFEKIGGHNPLEPAHFGVKLISGENIFLQKELFKYIKNVQFVKDDELFEALQNTHKLPNASLSESFDNTKVKDIIENIKNL